MVDLILKDIIEIDNDEEDDITFEERCDTESGNTCESCNFEVVAIKKYFAIQLISTSPPLKRKKKVKRHWSISKGVVDQSLKELGVSLGEMEIYSEEELLKDSVSHLSSKWDQPLS